jgi:predicted regulator of Ras-like GTPase activity (Roadblock/LC7/MglB family)
MEKHTLLDLQNLLARVTAAATGSGERSADTASVQAAQQLGCEVATGATFTKLIAAIEAEIAVLRTDG